jgi:GTPase SAR1 family protein
MKIIMNIVYSIGPAGAGKSTLTAEILNYLHEYNSEINVITLNLDPAVRKLPYAPDIDIQDYITLDEVIDETGLGPNGAMILATDKMVNYLEDLKYDINQYHDPEWLLVDTPGQMELFAFRSSGPMIASALGYGNVQRGILFCYDSVMCSHPNGYISTLLLGLSVQYRFSNLPQINVLTKKDLLEPEKLEEILGWMDDELNLETAIEMKERGMVKELTLALSRTLTDFGAIPELVPVSAKYHEGIDDLWGSIQRSFADDTSPYY